MGKQRQIDLKEDNVRLMEPEFVVNQPAIEFYVETWFDTDKYFGTEVNDDDDLWINMYLRYNYETGKLSAIYIIVDSNKGDQDFDWELTADEEKMFKKLLDEYAQDDGFKDISEWAEEYKKDLE